MVNCAIISIVAQRLDVQIEPSVLSLLIQLLKDVY
jgi:hypothetical protein